MNSKQLHYFCAIVEAGTISQAAKTLHMTQPPLSTQMKALENEIGSPLFIRGLRSIQLTDTGKLLYKRAQTILDLLDMTARDLINQKDGRGGTLKLGVVSSVNEQVLDEWILPFSKQYPTIHYEIAEANTYELIDKLSNRIIEIAIVRTPFPCSDTLKINGLRTECFFAVGTQVDPNLTSISLSELAEHPLILYRRWKPIFDEAFQKENCTPHYICINDDARTTIQWANAGLGWGIVPASSIYRINMPHVPLDMKFTSRICTLTLKDPFLSAPAQLFLKSLIEL